MHQYHSRPEGIPDHALDWLHAIKQLVEHSLCEELAERPVIDNMGVLRDYLFSASAFLVAEEFRVLFLGLKGHLLRDETLGHGSISEVCVYPREVVRRALELGAASMIVTHNHPAGDPAPSGKDIKVTRDLERCAHCLDIALLDHIIVARGGLFSFRSEGML